MRFVLALVTFVVAAALLAFGIAQRTVLRPADHVTMSASAPAGVRYVVIPGRVLRAHPGVQRIHLAGGGTTFAAYGRTADVTAWLSGQRYATVGLGGDGAPQTVVRTAPVVDGLVGGHPNPDGSDLWLDQERGSSSLDWALNVPSSVALLIASDGTRPAPSKISVTWSVQASTPWATPMIVIGSVLALLGLLLYIWALVHLRRRRGPRRKPPARMPKPPAPAKYRPTRQPAVVAAKGRRAVRRFEVLIAGVAAGTVLFTGSAAFADSPAPTSTAKAPSVMPAAVTEQQARRIVEQAATVERHADATLGAKALGARFTGPALALRTAAYRIHKADTKTPLPLAIPTTTAATRLILPEATVTWPRTLFTVVTDTSDTKTPPVALTLVQQTPRDPYRVEYAVALRPKAQMPALPSAVLGTSRLKPDTGLLAVPPGELADDYGLLLRKSGAPIGAAFDTSSDPLLKAVGQTAKAAVAKGLGGTAKVTFTDAPTDPTTVVALATADSGALVSVHLQETWTVKPTKSGVKVKPSGATKILAKTSSSTKGIASTYGYQLLFSVPPAAAKDPIELLGYAQGLISAKEL